MVRLEGDLEGEEVDGWDKALGQTQTGWAPGLLRREVRHDGGGGVIVNGAFVHSLAHTMSGKADG